MQRTSLCITETIGLNFLTREALQPKITYVKLLGIDQVSFSNEYIYF